MIRGTTLMTIALVVLMALVAKEARAAAIQNTCEIDHELEVILCEMQYATCVALDLPMHCYDQARLCTLRAFMRAQACKGREIAELDERLSE